MNDSIENLIHMILNHSYKIIGITGISGAGKTTFANYLKKNLLKYNKKVLCISLDDFVIYKSYRKFFSLKWRSQPESHNIVWLLQLLNQIKKKIYLCIFQDSIKQIMMLV
ncbi:MAG: hypothetical protein KatS3mg129_2932 [Leptospiraceae bacterium]|nr:MAG: hypothetical protein KatS3mg129_2932 [Leptospiraceae bacterium]